MTDAKLDEFLAGTPDEYAVVLLEDEVARYWLVNDDGSRSLIGGEQQLRGFLMEEAQGYGLVKVSRAQLDGRWPVRACGHTAAEGCTGHGDF